MLDKDVLAQLSQLKNDIVASKDLAEGVVVGSSGRYGFVKLDDGRNAFLNPDKMQRVLPGDRIKINVVTNDKEQLEGEFEEFVSSDLSRFVGFYKIKNGAHFVVPEDPKFNRWLFIPPQNRLRCKENDIVLAELSKHPYSDGKAAAKTIARIGTPDDDYIHHNLVIARFGLHRHWSKDAQAQVNECAQKAESFEAKDLTQLPFVTIDSASTKDMDDALYCESIDNGWRLWVAIASPGSFITPGSPIAKAAKYFAQSVYFPGRGLPMLPETLATEVFSLLPEKTKPALVCQLEISHDGEIQKFEFEQANISSKHKLTYQEVSEFISGDAAALEGCDDAVKSSLNLLAALATARLQLRDKNNLLFEEQADFDYQLNKKGLIESITKRERNEAQRMVEEAMVAVNLCAGKLLAEHNSGLFSTHLGFRPERIGEVRALLREELGSDENFENIDQFEHYVALIKRLQNSDTHRYVLAPLKRMMQNAEISVTPKPHMGMGFEHYAPVTSPIRRYVDLSNHWTILKILRQQKVQSLPEQVALHLQESISNCRQASRQLEQTLWAHYLSERIGMEGPAMIRVVTQQGFGVRLNDGGIEGFVQFPKKTEKSFDAKRMTLTVGKTVYALDQEVQVKVDSVDIEKRRVKLQVLNAAAEQEAEPEATQSVAPQPDTQSAQETLKESSKEGAKTEESEQP